MSASEKLSDPAFEEYLVIDQSLLCRPEADGLQFHPNLQCPLCESFKNSFICRKCLNTGSFVHSKSSNGPRIISTCSCLSSNGTSKCGTRRKLNTSLNLLRNTISYLISYNAERRRIHSKIRQAATRCYTASQQLLMRKSSLEHHFLTIAHRRKLLVVELNRVDQRIESMHNGLLKELLCDYFVTDLTRDEFSPDQFTNAALDIDRESIFAGPQPTPSSQTALTNCAIVIRVATILLDIWLPPPIRRQLHLGGSFLAALPQRDDLGRVFLAVIHAVHVLCASRGIDIKSTFKQLGISWNPYHSPYNPLFGFYCLGHTQRKDKIQSTFCGPYSLKLDGIFGSLSPPSPSLTPHFGLLPLSSPERQYVEQGEELNEAYNVESDGLKHSRFNEAHRHHNLDRSPPIPDTWEWITLSKS